MKYTLEEYITKVKILLECNGADKDDSQQYWYDFTNKQIDDNHIYFERLKKHGMSPYKALLYFDDYLEGHEICGLNVKPINSSNVYSYCDECGCSIPTKEEAFSKYDENYNRIEAIFCAKCRFTEEDNLPF